MNTENGEYQPQCEYTLNSTNWVKHVRQHDVQQKISYTCSISQSYKRTAHTQAFREIKQSSCHCSCLLQVLDLGEGITYSSSQNEANVWPTCNKRAMVTVTE